MNSPQPLTNVQAAAIIRAAIQRFDPQFDFPDHEVAVSPCAIIIGFVGGTTLVDRICELLFPKAPSGIYYHFTNLESLCNILSSQKLRFYNLHKRFTDGEFRLFCEDHGLDGYLAKSQTNPTRFVYQELMDDLFYTSLVDSGQKDSYRMWQNFGNEYQGVRLAFAIKADNHPDFRKIVYQANNKLPLFHNLQHAFQQYGRRFVVSGLSRFPAYYVCSAFQDESEWRLLAKRQTDGSNFQFTVHPVGTSDVKFIECAIAGTTCPQFQLQLVEVTAGTTCDIGVVRDQVMATQLVSAVQVTQA